MESIAMNSAIRFELDGDVGVLTFTSPERLNPLSLDLQSGAREILARVRENSQVRAVLLKGEGRGFCVGADLNSMSGGDEQSTLGERVADIMYTLTNQLILDLQNLAVPVVSVVNGAAAGAGVGLALAADIVVAARSAYFYLPFMPRLGLLPDAGTTWLLQRSIGRSRAMALSLLDERLSAEQAQQWGLVWSVHDDSDVVNAGLALARRLAALPADAAAECRKAFDAAARSTLSEQLAYETERQKELLDRPTFAEGVNAFIEKRKPAFKPRELA